MSNNMHSSQRSDDENDSEDSLEDPMLVEYEEEDNEHEPIPVPFRNKRPKRLLWTPEMDMTFVRLRLIENLTEGEIAKEMGLRREQVKGRIKRLDLGLMSATVIRLKMQAKFEDEKASEGCS